MPPNTSVNSSLTLGGDVTGSRTIAAFHGLCRRELAARPAHAIVIDLTQVTIADTKVIACLLWLVGLARKAAIALRIQFSQAVWRWVKLARVEAMLAPHVDDHPAQQ